MKGVYKLALPLAVALALVFAADAAPAPSPVTPELIAAAEKEGTVVFYSVMDLAVAEGVGKAFEKRYPGIRAQIERSGSERIFQRVEQEYASNIHVVDVIESGDIAHLLYWKRQGSLAPYVPEDAARLPAQARDPDGLYAVDHATLSVVAYNTRQVAPDQAPKSYADLLDPKWQGKIVKANPAYSGHILTATFDLSRALGWDYFKKLAQQRVMQVQSATDTPKKIALGERPVMFDGSEYVVLRAKASGAPLALVYPSEGTPLILGSAAVMKDAPHRNAARLFINFLFSREGQQFLVGNGQLRSLAPDIEEPADRMPLSKIKLLTADPEEQEKATEEVKRKYAEFFGR